MANKWKVSDADTFFEVYRDDQTHSYSLLSESEAHRLAKELDELHTLSEERRWRKIGEEWPEPGEWCQLANASGVRDGSAQWQGNRWVDTGADESIQPDGELYENGIGMEVFFTHWRPAPTDVPTDN